MKKKKHIETFFFVKNKKYKFYYKKNLKKFNSAKLFNTNFSKNYKIQAGLQALESGYLKPSSLKAVMKLIKWFLKKNKLATFFKLNTFPDFVLTSKPAEVRMGKGKGEPSVLVSEVKKNQIIVEFGFIKNKNLILRLLLLCKNKLNLKTRVVWNLW